MAALGTVACLSLASHLVLNQTLKAHVGAASVINVSGRQRMLSQRIASLAAQYELGDDQARRDLVSSVAEFETAHQRLVHHGLPSTTTPDDAPRLRMLYFGGGTPLDPQVHAYIARARRIAGLARSDPRMRPELSELFASARRPLLEGLNRVTAEHQRVSEEQLQRLQVMQLSALLLVLFTLSAEALGVFRPMVNRIMRYTRELNHAATTDALTGAANRRSFFSRARGELGRARRHDRPTDRPSRARRRSLQVGQ